MDTVRRCTNRRDGRYKEEGSGGCNALRAGRKAVCIFHAGAAPAVIENIYMLFMGHTCFKNQKRHRHTPQSILLLLLLLSVYPPLFLFCANPFSTSISPTLFLFLSQHSLQSAIFHSFFLTLVTLSQLFFLSLSSSLHALSKRPGKPLSPKPSCLVTSREFYKTFHASVAASATFPLTKQRILVWIEFLMAADPSRPATLFNCIPSLRPTALSYVYDVQRCLYVEHELHESADF